MTRASLATVYPSILTSYFCAQWWALAVCLVGDWDGLGWAVWGLGIGAWLA